MVKIAVASLGCSKNLVDTENILGTLRCKGYELVNEEAEADVIIVNTCCFIEDAKMESIEVILDLAQHKKEKCKALIVTGCMAERYKEEILKEMPEVDAVAAIGSDLTQAITAAVEGRREFVSEKWNLESERVLTTPGYTAYLKIADGCDNNCTYCVIPSIRGAYHSRTIDDIFAEAKGLAEGGVKELILIAQDTTSYGTDLYGESRLVELIDRLCELDIDWLRLQYCYPERITDELIDTIARQDKVCNYLDLPIQHCENDVLTRMGRLGTKQGLINLIDKIRKKIPDVVLRTTLIVGFPGESEQDFAALCDFVKEVAFDRLGVFAYSQEEDTAAALMEDQIDEDIKKQRQEMILFLQGEIAERISQNKIGTSQKVLIEGYDEIIKQYYGRTYADSPDVDGIVFAAGEKGIEPGMFVTVELTDAMDYDLYGEII